MTRMTRNAGLAVLAAIVLAVAVYGIANLSRGNAMSGVVIRAGAASVTSHDQLGASDSIVVDSVTVPDSSWVVAYRVGMQGMGGAILGYVHVPAGTSTDLRIPLDPSIRLTPFAIITLNADRGIPGRFEFAMNRFESSPDKPYYVAGHAVQTTITVALQENGDTFVMPSKPTQKP